MTVAITPRSRYIVTYGVGIYLLNNFIGFLSPQVGAETAVVPRVRTKTGEIARSSSARRLVICSPHEPTNSERARARARDITRLFACPLAFLATLGLACASGDAAGIAGVPHPSGRRYPIYGGGRAPRNSLATKHHHSVRRPACCWCCAALACHPSVTSPL